MVDRYDQASLTESTVPEKLIAHYRMDPRQIIVEHAEWLQLVDGPTAQLLDRKCRHRASNEPAPVRNREVILPGHRVKASASENELLQLTNPLIQMIPKVRLSS